MKMNSIIMSSTTALLLTSMVICEVSEMWDCVGLP